jgi:hypothetical protein
VTTRDTNKPSAGRVRRWLRVAGHATVHRPRSRADSDIVRRMEWGTFSPSLRSLNKIAAGLAVPVHALLANTYDEADDLAECIRALPEREFRIAIAMVRVLGRLTVGQPSGEAPSDG